MANAKWQTKPTVSVIIPCYNAERFLPETLRSVAAQTFRDFEVIAIDDGSTDGTAAVLEASPVSARILRGGNRGVSHARNWGTEVARGEFIQYLDADDLLLPQALEIRLKALNASGADVAYSNWQRLAEQEDGRFVLGALMNRRIEDVHLDIEIALFTDFWAPPAALLYRRTIVDKIGGWNADLPKIQDARFMLDAAHVGGRFVHVAGVGAQYREQCAATSLSRRDPLGFLQDIFVNAQQVEQRWWQQVTMTRERQQALARVYSYVVYEFFCRHDAEAFRCASARLLQVEPKFRLSKAKVSELLARTVGMSLARHLLMALIKLRQIF